MQVGMRHGMTPLSTRGHLVPPGAAGQCPPPAGPVPMLDPSGGSDTPTTTTTRGLDINRVIAAGGDLAADILHPDISPFEQLYRRLPEEGMFDPLVSPSRPFTFELGAFTVPDRMALMLFDLRPDIYRFSGVDAGDFVPIETRRFGSIMGFDITVDQRHLGQIAFQIDPVAIQRTSQQAFQNNNLVHPQANAGDFAMATAGAFASATGASTALLPQRPTRFGALSIPFTIYARSKQVVQTRCIIFRRIPTPIAFIEYDIAGVLIPEYWLDHILEAVKLPNMAGQERYR